MKSSFWVALALISLLVLFIVQNAAPVSIKVLFWSFNISMALLLFFIFLLGLIIGRLWFHKQKEQEQEAGSLDDLQE